MNLTVNNHKAKYKSLLMLLGANILNLVIYYIFDTGIEFIIWSYWFQSVGIGLVTLIKMVDKGLSNKQYLSLFSAYNLFIISFNCLFFILHYGAFQSFYFSFLKENFLIGLAALPLVVQGFIYYLNHLLSYFLYREKEKKKRSYTFLMLFPYIRTMPIHMFIIFHYSITSGGLVMFFIFLKIVADLIIHLIEHKNAD